uniref:Uncharacterized protein n=1 Tax=viral metagenome TaxID=1070528 RepID=A0A6M3IEF0_9ZZZZ
MDHRKKGWTDKELILIRGSANLSEREVSRKFGLSLNQIKYIFNKKLGIPKPKPFLKKKCPQCHKVFEGNGKQKFCSRKCNRKTYIRLHQLVTTQDGKIIYIYNITKRAYPEDEACELCGRLKKLAYHHWNDEYPEIGIWVCQKCHWICEGLDLITDMENENLIKKYELFRGTLLSYCAFIEDCKKADGEVEADAESKSSSD